MIQKHLKLIKEKLIGFTGSISGTASFLGSYQVCHNLCLSLITLLGIIGITVVGMPLLFLTKIAVPFWIAAVVLFLISIGVYFKKKCISNKLIVFNSGLIVAGIPFQPLQQFSLFFWSVGGALIALSLFLFVKDRIKRGTKHEK